MEDPVYWHQRKQLRISSFAGWTDLKHVGYLETGIVLTAENKLVGPDGEVYAKLYVRFIRLIL